MGVHLGGGHAGMWLERERERELSSVLRLGAPLVLRMSGLALLSLRLARGGTVCVAQLFSLTRVGAFGGFWDRVCCVH